MLIDTLDRAPETWIYNEADHSPAFESYRIRPKGVLECLIREAKAQCVIFKPLCDSQWVDHLLSVHPNAKAIWLYRDFIGVAASAERKWGQHQKDVIRRIANGEILAAGWRAERMTKETLAVLKELYSPTMSAFAGCALKWYMRNQIYFDLRLQDRKDVILVKYEDLVLKPKQTLPGVFEWLGVCYGDRYSEAIVSSSIGRFKGENLPEEIESLCGNMLRRFESIYLSQGITRQHG